jgi:hypothetical protein
MIIFSRFPAGFPNACGQRMSRFKKNFMANVVSYDRKTIIPQSFNIIFLIEWIVVIYKQIKLYYYDKIMATSPPFAPVIAVYLITRFLKIPYIIDYRDDLTSVINQKYPWLWPINIFWSFWLFKSIQNAEKVITVNETLKKALAKYNSNIEIIPNEIDLEELDLIKSRLSRESILAKHNLPNKPIMVYVGDLDMDYHRPELGCEYLPDGMIYVIIGNGKRKQKILNTIKMLHIEDKVFLLGRLPHEQVLEILLISKIGFYSTDPNYAQNAHAKGSKIWEYEACSLEVLKI